MKKEMIIVTAPTRKKEVIISCLAKDLSKKIMEVHNDIQNKR